MQDKFSDDRPSVPNAGGSEERHKHKDNRSSTGHSGVTPHPDKVGPGEGGISVPSHGGHVRPEKHDKNTSRPEGDAATIVTANLHEDKKAFEKARKHEPKPAGNTNSGGGKFVTSKRD